MNLCLQCQSKKHVAPMIETEEVFSICRKCGNAYYDKQGEPSGSGFGLFSKLKLLFH